MSYLFITRRKRKDRAERKEERWKEKSCYKLMDINLFITKGVTLGPSQSLLISLPVRILHTLSLPEVT